MFSLYRLVVNNKQPFCDVVDAVPDVIEATGCSFEMLCLKSKVPLAKYDHFRMTEHADIANPIDVPLKKRKLIR